MDRNMTEDIQHSNYTFSEVLRLRQSCRGFLDTPVT